MGEANYHSAPGDFLPCKNSLPGEYLRVNIRRGETFSGGGRGSYNGTPAQQDTAVPHRRYEKP